MKSGSVHAIHCHEVTICQLEAIVQRREGRKYVYLKHGAEEEC
jgi:hypothetical protein